MRRKLYRFRIVPGVTVLPIHFPWGAPKEHDIVRELVKGIDLKYWRVKIANAR